MEEELRAFPRTGETNVIALLASTRVVHTEVACTGGNNASRPY